MRGVGAWLGLGAVAAGCSVANAPADPFEPTVTVTSTASAGGGGEGGGPSDGGGGSGAGTPSDCGNGMFEGPDEECDTGGESATCDPDCTQPACGDGYHNASADEGCDDGNEDEGDACSAECEPTTFDIDPEAAAAAQAVPDVTIRADVGITEFGGNDHFLVVWGHAQDGAGTDLRVRESVYSRIGAPVGEVGKAVSTTVPLAFGPSLAANPVGRAIAVWTTVATAELRYRAIEPGGALVGNSDLIVAGAMPIGTVPAVAVRDATGEFCASWIKDEATDTVRVRCFDAMANPVGAEQTYGPASIINATMYPPVAIFSFGDAQKEFVLGWFDSNTAGTPFTGRRLNQTGQAINPQFAMFAAPNPGHAGNGIARADGGFTALAHHTANFGQGTARRRGVMRGFNLNATALGADILVSDVHEDEASGWLVRGPGDHFLTVWQTSTGCALRGRRWQETATGADPVGDPITFVPPSVVTCGYHPRGIANSDGDVMLVWTLTDTTPANPFKTRVQGLILPGLLAP